MQFSSNNDPNIAISKFESMLKTNDVFFFDSEEFENIIHHYLDNGKTALAKKAIRIGLDQHPSVTALKLIEIELMVFENKLDEAERLLDQLHTLETSNEEIYIQKANIYSKRDEHYKAIELLKIALAYTNDEGDVYSLLGMEHLFIDDFIEAKRYFKKCVTIDPQDYAALYNIIYCYEFLDDTDGAIDFLNMYLDRNPYCEVAWHQLGKQYYSKKLYKEALSCFDFAVISDDTFIGAYLEKGKALEKLNRFEEAIEHYEITLQLDDPTSFAYLRMGKCHEQLGNTEIALQYYKKTVHEDPLLDKGWLALTDYYIEKKNYQKALYYINKALNIDSENIRYWKRSAKINTILNFYEEAHLSYKRMVELGNYEFETWISWANILTFLGEFESAIHTLLKGLEFYPEAAQMEYHLAGLYYLLGKNTEGIFHLNNGLRENYEYYHTIAQVFPSVFNRPAVKKIIENFKNTQS